jgi:ABC-type phosphate transport system substrate-binding protein
MEWTQAVGVAPGFRGLSFPPSVVARFGSRLQFVNGSTNVVSTVVRTPFSLTFSYLSTAKSHSLPTAKLINAAQATVSPSLTAAALAANELNPSSVKFDDLSQWYDMSNPSGAQAWPFTVMTTIVFDKLSTRSACKTKSEMVSHLTRQYTIPLQASKASHGHDLMLKCNLFVLLFPGYVL